MVRVDCGELQEEHSISKLTGSPAGYIGHGQTEALITPEILAKITSKKHNVNIVLIDEIEKASASLERLLLAILDTGKMTTASNKVVDFSNTIFILTSNLGQGDMQKILTENNNIGFAKINTGTATDQMKKRDDRLVKAALYAAGKRLSPEFLNRINKTFVFSQLTPEESLKVLNMNLAAVQRKNFFANTMT